MDHSPVVALVYDDDAYVEAGGAAIGLMGRQVAGKAFLEAYLKYGSFSETAALVGARDSAASLAQAWRDGARPAEPARRLRLIGRGELYGTLVKGLAPEVFHFPQPPDPALAWLRQQAQPHAFLLTGVTHTLCSAEAVKLLRALVTAPFEPYDALVCTSRAVAAMVREVTAAYSEYLMERFGHRDGLGFKRVDLMEVVIPLGVDVERFAPATAAERATARGSIGVTDEEVAVLYVGRFSHHAKAQPFPIFRSVSLAARSSLRKVHLIMAGWAAHPAVIEAFKSGASRFAPEVRTSFLDGRDACVRRDVWHAADVFVSPSDSIQETFGLSVIEAMASGLPVVASDWNGYRDLIEDGRTGFLVPTAMVSEATASATARLLTGELNYDHFLAEIGQTATVDIPSMAGALTRLLSDQELRLRMGAAGCARAREQFAWATVIGEYERLWRHQDEKRRRAVRLGEDRGRWRGPAGPAAYPAPETAFAGYPTRWLGNEDRVAPAPGASGMIDELLALPLSNHAPNRRVSDPELVRGALALAPCSVENFDRYWFECGVEKGLGRSTLAWMLKYDLVRADFGDRPVEGPAR